MGQIATIIISIITTVISTILAFMLKSKIKENKELKREKAERDSAMEDAMVCLLRTQLMSIHDECMTRGSIKSKELENGILMYRAYKTLGGNGMIDHMEDEIQHLPIKD